MLNVMMKSPVTKTAAMEEINSMGVSFFFSGFSVGAACVLSFGISTSVFTMISPVSRISEPDGRSGPNERPPEGGRACRANVQVYHPTWQFQGAGPTSESGMDAR